MLGTCSVYQFRVDKWIKDPVHTKGNPVCCQIDSFSLLSVKWYISARFLAKKDKILETDFSHSGPYLHLKALSPK